MSFRTVDPVQLLQLHSNSLRSHIERMDLLDFCTELCKYGVLSRQMRENFRSIDCSNVAIKLRVRYLFNLICDKIFEDKHLFPVLLIVLSSYGREAKSMYNILSKEHHEGVKRVGGEAAQVQDLERCLSEGDIPYLVESLANGAHKWEEISIALKLPENKREDIRIAGGSSVTKLNKVLQAWVSENFLKPVNLSVLKNALAKSFVGLASLADNLHLEDLLPASKISRSDHSCPDSDTRILYQSVDASVSYGKSTLLEVQVNSSRSSVSYQWFKDGHELSDDDNYENTKSSILLVRHRPRHMASEHIEGKYFCQVDDRLRSDEIIVESFPKSNTFNLDHGNEVFILYCKDTSIPNIKSDDWSHTVFCLADLLSHCGRIKCTIDYYEKQAQGNWGVWTEERIKESNFVVLVMSPLMAHGLRHPSHQNLPMERGLFFLDSVSALISAPQFVPVFLNDCLPPSLDLNDWLPPKPTMGSMFHLHNFFELVNGYTEYSSEPGEEEDAKFYRYIQASLPNPRFATMASLVRHLRGAYDSPPQPVDSITPLHTQPQASRGDKQESEYVVREETSVRYEGKSLGFVSEDQGLELLIDDDALSPDTSSCDIKISTVIPTDLFKYPKGFELASEIYKIECHCHFIKPVELKIKHNVEISTSKLFFAVASDERPPYNFYCENEGEFDVYYGTMKLSSFSFWTILREMIFGPSRYTINLYSNDRDLTKDNDMSQLCMVVTKSDVNLAESAKATLSNMTGQQLFLCTSLTGESDDLSEVIEFELEFEPEEASHLKITLQNPLHLEKSSIDNYSVGSTPIYVGLKVSSNKKKEEIELKINIRGLKGNDKFLTYTCTSFAPGLPFIVDANKKEVSDLLHSVGISKSSLQAPCTAKDLCDIADQISADSWTSLALELGLLDYTLDNLRQNYHRAEEQRFEGLKKWKHEKANDASYYAFVLACVNKGNTDLALYVCQLVKQHTLQ